MNATAARALGFTTVLTMSFSVSTAVMAEEEFMPWAPATAGLPSVETSTNKVYVHGIKPSVGMDESIGPPLSAAFVSSVRKAAWSKDREIQSADEIKLSSPNVGSYIEGCSSGPCVVEIARSVGCGVAISATVSKVGSTFLVDAIVVESGKGTVLGRETERVRGRNESSLLDSHGLPKVIKKLLQGLPDLDAPAPAVVAQATPPPAEPTAPQPPAPEESAPPQTAPPAESPTPTAEPAQPPEAPGADAAEGDTTTEAATAEETSGDEIGIRVEEEEGATDEEGASAETDVATADTEEEGGFGDVLTVSGYVLLGAGVLVGAVGGIAHLAALNADGEVEKERHAANQVNAIIGQGLFYQNAAFVLYGIGAAGLLLGIAGIGGGACL